MNFESGLWDPSSGFVLNLKIWSWVKNKLIQYSKTVSYRPITLWVWYGI
jgi:hypothetical protein